MLEYTNLRYVRIHRLMMSSSHSQTYSDTLKNTYLTIKINTLN